MTGLNVLIIMTVLLATLVRALDLILVVSRTHCQNRSPASELRIVRKDISAHAVGASNASSVENNRLLSKVVL